LRHARLLDLGDELGATRVHLNHRELSVIAFRARRSDRLDRLQ